MTFSKDPEIININMDDDVHTPIRKYHNLSTWAVYWQKMEKIKTTIQRIKEAKVVFNNKKQHLWSNNFSLEIKKKLIRSLYLECCTLWIRNKDRGKKWRGRCKCIWNMEVVRSRIYPVDGLSPRAQNIKKGGALGAVGPKIKYYIWST